MFNMLVSGFMIPAEKVVTATPDDTVMRVMDLMINYHVGAVVIVNNPESGTTNKVAVGIVTKSDILTAYRNGVEHGVPCKEIMGKRKLVSCHPNDDQNKVAKTLQEHKTHHVIVVDQNQAHFVGLVSSWDVAAQCAKGGISWFPSWKMNVPAPFDPEKEITIVNHPHDKKTTFMDDLDMEAFQ